MTATCPKCHGPAIPLFTSYACKNECDLVKAAATPRDRRVIRYFGTVDGALGRRVSLYFTDTLMPDDTSPGYQMYEAEARKYTPQQLYSAAFPYHRTKKRLESTKPGVYAYLILIPEGGG